MKNKILNVLFIFFCFFTSSHTLHLHANEITDDDLVFVILSHVRDAADDDLWQRSYDSIREFYPDAPVVLINDNSPFAPSIEKKENLILVESEFPGAGEILPYYYFLKYKWANKMIFLHDSMRVIRAFTPAELSAPVKFHWFFATHQWDDFYPTYDLLSFLKNSSELTSFKSKHHLWMGCFGTTSTISLDALQQVEDKYSLTETLVQLVNCRNQRCALERVFAIVMFNEGLLNVNNCSNFGEIFEHPAAYTYINEDGINSIKNSDYSAALIKTWRGR